MNLIVITLKNYRNTHLCQINIEIVLFDILSNVKFFIALKGPLLEKEMVNQMSTEKLHNLSGSKSLEFAYTSVKK